jgi:hypothetical protein
VQPQIPFVYLWLRFEDPDGEVRDFPQNFPLIVRFSPPGAAAGPVREKNIVLQPDGRLIFPAWDRNGQHWRSFLLRVNTSPDFPLIVCEASAALVASPVRSSRYLALSALPAELPSQERFFALPRSWQMRQADWRFGARGFGANGAYDSPVGLFRHTSPRADIGSRASPVELILHPHWHFLRQEFYDRYFGNAHLDNPPRAALRKRISIPPVRMEGFRTDAFAASSPFDTFSNWVAGAASPPELANLLQCLPMILRRAETGPDFSPPAGTQLGLRFRTPANTMVYSESVTRRRILTSPAPPPGPDRLRMYDLPEMWKSRGYYTRRTLSSPAAAGKFFQTLSAAEIREAEQKAKPLVFCLDDMVIAVGNPATRRVTSPLSPFASRVAIFNHRFDRRIPNSTAQGLYRNLLPATAADELDLPRSNVAPVANYVADYPDWTRLILTGGNLHEVFNARMPDASPPDAVGARAAVRWEDSMRVVLRRRAWDYSPATQTASPAADNRPLAGRILLPQMAPRINVPAASPHFSIQAFFNQFGPAAASPFSFDARTMGRHDIALLRCCDIQSGKEVALNLHYIRQNFDFLSPPAIPRRDFVYHQATNVTNRWSGNEPGVSTERAAIVPSPPSAASPVPLHVPVVWFLQSVPLNQAHFKLTMTGGSGRDDRHAQSGTGKASRDGYQPSPPLGHASGAGGMFTSAHETGHMGSMPDEYNERSDGQSYRAPSFVSRMPGDPYDEDVRRYHVGTPAQRMESGMMQSNQHLRNRYFWPGAEWVRRIINMPVKVSLGSGFPDFQLPQHQQAVAGQTYYCWPLTQQVSPPAPNRRGMELFLYALGKDHYSQRLLFGAPYDGIFIIVVKIRFRVPGNATRATEDAERADILRRPYAVVRNFFNQRWIADGTANYGSPATPHRFRRCLIQVTPQAIVANYPFEPPLPPSPPAPNGQRANATTLLARWGFDFTVDIQGGGAAGGVWATANQLNINYGASTSNVDGHFVRHFPRMIFGTDKDVSAVAGPTTIRPADWERIVRRLIPGATVRPA